MPPSRGCCSRSPDEGGSRRPDCGPRRAAADGCPATLVGSRRGRDDCWPDSGARAAPHAASNAGRANAGRRGRCSRRRVRPEAVPLRPRHRPCRKSPAAPPAPGLAPPPAPTAPVEARGTSRKLFTWPAEGRAPAATSAPAPPAPTPGRAAAPAPAAGRAAPARPLAELPPAPPDGRRAACPGRRSAHRAPPAAAPLHRLRLRAPRLHHRLRHRERGCRPGREEGSLRRTPRESLHVSCRHLDLF